VKLLLSLILQDDESKKFVDPRADTATYGKNLSETRKLAKALVKGKHPTLTLSTTLSDAGLGPASLKGLRYRSDRSKEGIAVERLLAVLEMINSACPHLQELLKGEIVEMSFAEYMDTGGGEGWAAERKRKGDIFRERDRVKIESFEFSGLCGTVVDYDSRWVWVQLDDADPESDPEAFRDHHLIWDWSVMTSSDKDVDKVVKVRDLAGKCGTVVSNSGHKVTVAVDGEGDNHATFYRSQLWNLTLFGERREPDRISNREDDEADDEDDGSPSDDDDGSPSDEEREAQRSFDKLAGLKPKVPEEFERRPAFVLGSRRRLGPSELLATKLAKIEADHRKRCNDGMPPVKSGEIRDREKWAAGVQASGGRMHLDERRWARGFVIGRNRFGGKIYSSAQIYLPDDDQDRAVQPPFSEPPSPADMAAATPNPLEDQQEQDQRLELIKKYIEGPGWRDFEWNHGLQPHDKPWEVPRSAWADQPWNTMERLQLETFCEALDEFEELGGVLDEINIDGSVTESPEKWNEFMRRYKEADASSDDDDDDDGDDGDDEHGGNPTAPSTF
jgi:hypothetical protein